MKTLIVLFIALFLCLSVYAGERRDLGALVDRLEYLHEIQEIGWVIFENNNVYIGFKSIPVDMGTIVRGAAYFGNKAYNFGVHVWALNARYKENYKSAPVYCKATARHGRVIDCSCK